MTSDAEQGQRKAAAFDDPVEQLAAMLSATSLREAAEYAADFVRDLKERHEVLVQACKKLLPLDDYPPSGFEKPLAELAGILRAEDRLPVRYEAAMIAAAPDLLAACSTLTTDPKISFWLKENEPGVLERVRSAVSKARSITGAPPTP